MSICLVNGCQEKSLCLILPPLHKYTWNLSSERMFSYALLPGNYSQSTQHNWYTCYFIYQCAFYFIKYLAKLIETTLDMVRKISAGIGSM
jgi:hypothetical protein